MAKAKAKPNKAKPVARSKPEKAERAPKPTPPAKLERKLTSTIGKAAEKVKALATKAVAKVAPPVKGVKAALAEKPAPVTDPKGKALKPTRSAPSAVEEPPAPGKRTGPTRMPRATKLPPLGNPLTKREMEQLLTAGTGRGVEGEGSLKGRLVVREEFPYLVVVGRDKRELSFLLQGPDQEVLPAYVEHKVSVSGLIHKTTNYGGTVDVRKYSAKKPDTEPVAPAPVEEKLKYLSPGEVVQLCSAGMGAGVRGFASMRGNLEMTGEDYFLVVSNAGTRQQVSFVLQGKGAKGLRKYVGQALQANGVVEKTSGWGGRIEVEAFEPKPSEHKTISREGLEIVNVVAEGDDQAIEVRSNASLTVRLEEQPGFTWALEPTVAKRLGLRAAIFEPSSSGPATREFFFTPRTPGPVDAEFFLAKVLAPAQVQKTYRLHVAVKP